MREFHPLKHQGFMNRMIWKMELFHTTAFHSFSHGDMTRLLNDLYSINVHIKAPLTLSFCLSMQCLTDFSFRSPIHIAMPRSNHLQNTFSVPFGHSSYFVIAALSHDAWSSAFEVDTHYFRSMTPARYNHFSSVRVTFS